jgi:sugar fermentation stimulation protein A
MKFQSPLSQAVLIQRYKRFLADIRLPDGREVTAHCANPGAMTGLAEPDMKIWVDQNDDPKRKLNYSWKLVEIGDHLACVDTALPNHVVAEALENGAIAPLQNLHPIRREVRYGENSRIDFLLGAPEAQTYVEVKAVSLKRSEWAEFPDTVTKRGAKHLAELSEMVRQGHRAVMLFLVQRTDCTRFRVAGDIDPAYAAAFLDAQNAGVEMMCFETRISPDGMTVADQLPIDPPIQK